MLFPPNTPLRIIALSAELTGCYLSGYKLGWQYLDPKEAL